MKNREARKIVVKCISSERYKGDLEKDLRSNRFLPNVGQKFKILTTELILMGCEPEGAAFTGPNTEVELMLDEIELKECSIFDHLIPDLLGDQQRILLELLEKKFDGDDIPIPNVIFLLGPPATSKTEVLNAIKKKAENRGWAVVNTDGPTIMGRYIGDVAEYIKEIRDDVDERFVIIIDEIDTICGERTLGAGGGFLHLMETVTSLNRLLDTVIEKGGIAVFASNVKEFAIDQSIKSRSLMVNRESISDEILEKATVIFAKRWGLSEDVLDDIKKMGLKNFRDINIATRLRACGLDHEKTVIFMEKERKKKKEKQLVYVG